MASERFDSQVKTNFSPARYSNIHHRIKSVVIIIIIIIIIIILDVLGGSSKDLDVTLQKLVGSKAKGVLKKMQKACLSGTLNIGRTFKVI